jgi:hypothetical protein
MSEQEPVGQVRDRISNKRTFSSIQKVFVEKGKQESSCHLLMSAKKDSPAKMIPTLVDPRHTGLGPSWIDEDWLMCPSRCVSAWIIYHGSILWDVRMFYSCRCQLLLLGFLGDISSCRLVKVRWVEKMPGSMKPDKQPSDNAISFF